MWSQPGAGALAAKRGSKHPVQRPGVEVGRPEGPGQDPGSVCWSRILPENRQGLPGKRGRAEDWRPGPGCGGHGPAYGGPGRPLRAGNQPAAEAEVTGPGLGVQLAARPEPPKAAPAPGSSGPLRVPSPPPPRAPRPGPCPHLRTARRAPAPPAPPPRRSRPRVLAPPRDASSARFAPPLLAWSRQPAPGSLRPDTPPAQQLRLTARRVRPPRGPAPAQPRPAPRGPAPALPPPPFLGDPLD